MTFLKELYEDSTSTIYLSGEALAKFREECAPDLNPEVTCIRGERTASGGRDWYLCDPRLLDRFPSQL
jgi:hypothetical protein